MISYKRNPLDIDVVEEEKILRRYFLFNLKDDSLYISKCMQCGCSGCGGCHGCS